MPPGPNKRKAAKKKKKKAKPSKNSGSTPVHSPRDGESDDGELSSTASNSQQNSPLPPIKAETMEANPSAKKPSTTEKTEKASMEKNGKIEIDRGSSSPTPQEKILIPKSSSPDNKSRDKKKAVVIESAPVDSSGEKGIHNSVNNNTKLQEKNDSVMTKTPLKQTMVDENASNNNHPKETGLEELVEKLVSVDKKASPKSKDCLTASALNCPFCGRGSADRVKENGMPECPERHPLLDPNPQAPEKTSWKSCCGIFELCSK